METGDSTRSHEGARWSDKGSGSHGCLVSVESELTIIHIHNLNCLANSEFGGQRSIKWEGVMGSSISSPET